MPSISEAIVPSKVAVLIGGPQAESWFPEKEVVRGSSGLGSRPSDAAWPHHAGA